MSLPTVTCPSCNAAMSLDALLGHQGARDALLGLATLHKSQRLQMAALRYVGLFAPPKQVMRLDRVADLLRELTEILAPARVEWKGASFAAPLDYWIDAMEDMAARRAELDLPMKGHGYLKSVVAGYGSRAAHFAEKAAEDRAAGRTPVGAPPPPAPGATTAPAKKFRPQTEQMQSLRDVLKGAAPIPTPSQENPNGQA